MTYYVDRDFENGPGWHPNCELHFKPFDSLKAASKYARKHGCDSILDDNGDPVTPWKSREQLQEEAELAKGQAKEFQEAVRAAAARRDKDAEEHEARMLQAGYIPLEKFRNMVSRNFSASKHNGFGVDFTVTIMVPDTDVRAANIFNAIVNGRP